MGKRAMLTHDQKSHSYRRTSGVSMFVTRPPDMPTLDVHSRSKGSFLFCVGIAHFRTCKRAKPVHRHDRYDVYSYQAARRKAARIFVAKMHRVS